ncbi:MAG: fatty acid desaturase [Spirochaetes bacterium]|nr:MAG: fatty acid desaturase [Spirochaetota bacterium]
MKRPDWFDKLQPYAYADISRSLLYICTSVVPYLAMLALMYFVLDAGYPYWTVLLMAVLATGFYIRTFMILHDCSHMSFMKSKYACFILGHVCGVFTFTPFFDWQRNHGIHHANVSNLDKRGIGDVWTMTLAEYRVSAPRYRLLYRFFRNPWFLFVIAPIFLFFIMYRFPQKSTRRKDYFSIAFTNVVLAAIMIASYFTIGIGTYFAIQMPILVLATSTGMWLFFIQHQFREVYWAHQGEWDLISAAMNGSSFYNLPAVLRWFSGNIGYHNIHHAKPRIPCYRLKKCYDEVPDLHYTIPITLFRSFRSLRYHLWDEATGTLLSFGEAREKIGMETG